MCHCMSDILLGDETSDEATTNGRKNERRHLDEPRLRQSNSKERDRTIAPTRVSELRRANHQLKPRTNRKSTVYKGG